MHIYVHMEYLDRYAHLCLYEDAYVIQHILYICRNISPEAVSQLVSGTKSTYYGIVEMLFGQVF